VIVLGISGKLSGITEFHVCAHTGGVVTFSVGCHDSVYCSFTAHVTPDGAREIAAALISCADELVAHPPTEAETATRRRGPNG
jgi:hypothetical protein